MEVFPLSTKRPASATHRDSMPPRSSIEGEFGWAVVALPRLY